MLFSNVYCHAESKMDGYNCNYYTPISLAIYINFTKILPEIFKKIVLNTSSRITAIGILVLDFWQWERWDNSYGQMLPYDKETQIFKNVC